MVSITDIKYNFLLRAYQKLDALERHGVDNWEWYGNALADLAPLKEIDKEILGDK